MHSSSPPSVQFYKSYLSIVHGYHQNFSRLKTVEGNNAEVNYGLAINRFMVMRWIFNVAQPQQSSNIYKGATGEFIQGDQSSKST